MDTALLIEKLNKTHALFKGDFYGHRFTDRKIKQNPCAHEG